MQLIRPMTIQDAQLTSSSVAETDYTAYAGGTTYVLGDRVRVVSTNVHQVYESLQASNTGHTPGITASVTWWALVGATNRWKMFDQSVSSQTSNTTSIDVVLAATGRVDSIALLNINAYTINVKMTDLVDGIVYNTTQSGVAPSSITDWYAYFFEPVVRVSDLVFTDLPPYANSSLEITLTDTGNTVLCGGCVVGQKFSMGVGAELGATVGIQSYSVKTQDAYGNYSVTPRAFNKRANFTVYMDWFKVDQTQSILTQYRDTPVVYIGTPVITPGTPNYTSTIIYGFYKDFSIEIAYPIVSICSLEIEGLT